MKKTTKAVLGTVHRLSLDSFFAALPSSYKGLKKFVPHPSYYGQNDEVLVKRSSASFRVNRSDWMQWHIYANLEDNSWKYALNALKATKENKFIVLDIGSNVGAFSFKLASNLMRNGLEDFTIHAFDPNPYVRERFEKNREANSLFKGKVFFYPFALSGADGTAFFDFTSENSGTGSIREKGFPVQVTSIDNFCKSRLPGKINFMKIDVEGFEPFVFDGGRSIIEKYKPVIYAEISPRLYEAKGRSANEIFNYLHHEGYSLYKDMGCRLGIIQPDKIDYFLKEEQFNILAVQS